MKIKLHWYEKNVTCIKKTQKNITNYKVKYI